MLEQRDLTGQLRQPVHPSAAWQSALTTGCL